MTSYIRGKLIETYAQPLTWRGVTFAALAIAGLYRLIIVEFFALPGVIIGIILYVEFLAIIYVTSRYFYTVAQGIDEQAAHEYARDLIGRFQGILLKPKSLEHMFQKRLAMFGFGNITQQNLSNIFRIDFIDEENDIRHEHFA